MLTHVEFISTAFPPYETEFEQVNPGRFGKRLAEFVATGLREQGEPVEELRCEDWGWVVPIAHEDFELWIGVGNFEESTNQFLCFIEPHSEQVRRWFKKVSTVERIDLLRSRFDAVLGSHEGIRDVKWSTHDEIVRPAI